MLDWWLAYLEHAMEWMVGIPEAVRLCMRLYSKAVLDHRLAIY